MTVKELYEKCKEEISNGKADNDIVLCVNENEFYPLEAGFSSPINNRGAVHDLLEDWEADEDDVSVLN